MRTLPPLLVLVLTLSAVPGVRAGASPTDTAGFSKAVAHVRVGNDAYKSGNTKKAREEFEKALELTPGLPDALIGMGLISMGEKDYAKALAQFEGARDGFANLGEALYDLALKRYQDAQQAIRELTSEITRLRSRQSQTAGSESALQTQISQLESRVRTMEAIRPPDESEIREVPGEVFFHIGNAQFQLGRIDEARAAWETCSQRSPDFPLVQNNLAIVYFKEGRIDEALACLDRAEKLGLKVNPRFRSDLEAAKKKASGP